ncbi:hypothetical protein AAHA92_28837 [Salvia divinorum]|uniref:Uncharacterized protein n=1 Tax=Salvia divinorum TaxID=28513 RepID=A0ABD1FWC4_SALDI
MSPYRLIFRKMCHLLVGVEHKAYWTIKEVNLKMDACEEKWKFHLQELEELRLESYDSTMWCKEKTKLWHDRNLRSKELQIGQKGSNPNSSSFLVNGHRVKLFRDSSELCVVEEIPLRMPASIT